MRVLIPVDHGVGISGPHRNVVGSLNALGARDDVEVVLLTSMVDANEPYASAPNIDIRLGFLPHDPRHVLSNLVSVRSAARGCDVIYVPSGLKAFMYAQVGRRGRRLVAGPNVTPVPFGRRHRSPGKMEIRYLSDAWIEMSRHRLDHVKARTGLTGMEYVHHALDLGKFSPVHRRESVWTEFGVPTNAIKILFVGRDSEPRKGVPQLLDAAALLEHDSKASMHFVLVGRFTEATRARSDQLTNVSVLGPQLGTRLAELYASADIAVIPSSWESFGFTVLESMASGLPVISVRAGAIPEVIRDGESGVLLDISDQRSRHTLDAAERIAGSILSLANDAERRVELGNAARLRAERHFSEDRLGRDLMSVFRGDPVVHCDDPA